MAKRKKPSVVDQIKDVAGDVAEFAKEATLDVAEVMIDKSLDIAENIVEEVVEIVSPSEEEEAVALARLEPTTFVPKAVDLHTQTPNELQWKKGEPFRILSMDGAAGVLQYVRFLRDLVTHTYDNDPANFPGFLRHIHVLTGNSGGTLAAIYLARRLNDLEAPPSGQEECQILDELVAFVDEFFEVSAGGLEAVARAIRGTHAACENEKLRDFLQDSYGNLRLADCQAPALNILSFRMYNGSGPQNYFSPALVTGAESNAESNPTLVDLGLRSSAFPICLPMVQGHIDGALIANNPSMQTICRLRQAAREATPANLASLKLDDMRLLSLGADNKQLDAQIDFTATEDGLPAQKDWGWIPWIGALLKDILDKEPSPSDLPKRIQQVRHKAPQLVLLGEVFCDGDGLGIFEACKSLLGAPPVFRLALPTTNGLIVDGILWFLGDDQESIRDAEERATWWRDQPDDDSKGPSFHETLAWLGNQWWDNTSET